MQVGDVQANAEHPRQTGDVVVEEIVVLEEGQNANVGDKAQQQVSLLQHLGRGFGNEDAGPVVDDYGESQYQYVFGLEIHIESAGCQ